LHSNFFYEFNDYGGSLTSYSPLNLTDHALVLCDSRVKHSLVDSEYNTRRQECEKAVEVLRNYHPEVHSLRDVTEPMLREHRHELPGKVYDRALYVVQEIARVLQASDDLKAGRLEAFGKKMFETHHGLSKLYEVSCAELDFLVEEAQKNKAVLGARMMGGGFGGCTINLIRNDVRQGFLEKLSRSYREKFGIDPGIYPVTIADGTKIISDSKHE
jgi:galactokinase